jgi:hypothetical protein
MVTRERLTRLELRGVAAAVLAPIPIAREQESVRDLSAESAGHVDEFRQSNHRGSRQREPLGADHLVLIRFDDFGLAIDHEAKRPSHRDHGQRLERRIQSQTTNDHANPP